MKRSASGLLVLAASLALLAGCGAREPAQKTEVVPESKAPLAVPAEAKTVPPKAMPAEALFVCLSATNQIAVVDLKSGEVAARMGVGASPIAIAKTTDGSFLYIANSNSGDITVLDARSGKSEAAIPAGVQPVDLALAPDGKTLYVADYHLNGVRMVNTRLKSLTGVLGLEAAGYAQRTMSLDCCLDSSGNLVQVGRGPMAIALDPNSTLTPLVRKTLMVEGFQGMRR